MKKRFISLFQNKFVKNVIIMASGALTAQMIGMVLSPIITRMYGPEAYGTMGVFISITTILIPIAALTYPISIVLPKGDTNARALCKLSVMATIGVSLFILLMLIFFEELIVNLLNLESIASFLYLIPLVLFFSGLMQVIEQWLIRKKEFKTISKVSVMQSAISQGGKVGVGFFHPSAAVLIILTTLNNGIRALMMFNLAKRSNILKSNLNESKISLKSLAKKYIDFPLYRAPEAFISAFSVNLPVLLLSAFFGTAAVGFYSIGKTVLALPSNLIGKAVGDVFYPHISESANKGKDLNKIIKKATLSLAIIGIIPFGIIVAFGPYLFEFVFGEGWGAAGEYARWMALWVFFGFINKPSMRALPVLSAQSFLLKFTLFMLLIRVISLWIGYYVYNSDIIAIILFSISGAILNAVLILITLQISKKFEKTTEIN